LGLLEKQWLNIVREIKLVRMKGYLFLNPCCVKLVFSFNELVVEMLGYIEVGSTPPHGCTNVTTSHRKSRGLI
jgi:hypothetical protein